MAKEILKQGIKTYTGHCDECGADFTYQREDVRHNYVRGGEDVGCPCCGHGVRHFGEAGTRWPRELNSVVSEAARGRRC